MRGTTRRATTSPARSISTSRRATCSRQLHLEPRHPGSPGRYTPSIRLIPPIYNDNHGQAVSGSWRSSPTAHVHQRAARRLQFAPSTFKNRQNQPSYFLTGPDLQLAHSRARKSARAATSTVQHRRTMPTGSRAATASRSASRCSCCASSSIQRERHRFPLYGIGISAASPYGFTTGRFPGAARHRHTRANTLLASLAGLLSTGRRPSTPPARPPASFRARRRRSKMTFDQYAFYFLDNFKLRRT